MNGGDDDNHDDDGGDDDDYFDDDYVYYVFLHPCSLIFYLIRFMVLHLVVLRRKIL